MVFTFPPANVGEVKIVFTIDYTRYNKSNRRRCNKWSARNYRDYLDEAISSVSAVASQLSSPTIFPRKDSQRCHIPEVNKEVTTAPLLLSVFNIRASLTTKIVRTFWLFFPSSVAKCIVTVNCRNIRELGAIERFSGNVNCV